MKLPRRKHLVIFDFDETLCHTNGSIYIKDKDGDITAELTPSEYIDWIDSADYKNSISKWDLDFTDFQGFPEKGKPIEETLGILRKYISDENYVTCLVTGRDELSGPAQFLNSWGISIDQMVLMCSGGPDKIPCYESLFNTFFPNSVTIYEDCNVHILQCEAVCAKYRIPCASVLIEDGKINWAWRLKNEKYHRRNYE